MAVERYGSKTDVVVKLILVFFISLLSFAIGTFVGKKFSDNKYKLTKLEPSAEGGGHETAAHNEDKDESRQVASVDPKARQVKPDEPLTDEEIAKLSEEFAADSEDHETPVKHDKNNTHSPKEATAKSAPSHGDSGHGKAPEQNPADVTAAAHAPANAHAAVAHVPTARTGAPSAAAHNLANNHAPAPKVAAANQNSRIPSSLPQQVAGSSVGKFTVQVASYGSENEAQTKAAELKTKGYSAFYVPAKIKGQTWYRVSIGLYSTQKEADSYRRELTAKGAINSSIVQKISAE